MKGAVRQLNLKRDRAVAGKGRANLLFSKMKRTAGIVLLTTAISLSVFAAKPVILEPPRKEVAELVMPHVVSGIKKREKAEPSDIAIEEKTTTIKTAKTEIAEKETTSSEKTAVFKIAEEKSGNTKTNIPKLKPYLFWRAPILGNLLYAKSIRYKKYVRQRKKARVKEWKKQHAKPVAFHASKVVVPELKRHFPASTVIPKKA